MKSTKEIYSSLQPLIMAIIFCFGYGFANAQNQEKGFISFTFDGNEYSLSDTPSETIYTEGLAGKAVDLGNSTSTPSLSGIYPNIFSNSKNFSVSVWIKTEVFSSDTTIVLSNADFRKFDMGIYGERRIANGITLYSCNGSWGWNIGNGKVHYNYEPIYQDQPIADNKWHNIVFTFNSSLKEVRLFYDGVNKATLSIGDLSNQDFASGKPLIIGTNNKIADYSTFPGLMDELKVWNKSLSKDQVGKLYKKYRKIDKEPVLEGDILTILNWNIWHGGTHFVKDVDGFDGVERIIEMIKESNADIVLMQETYGAGSKISSGLGYYYYEASSTIGAVWGANLSVMSRFPIENVYLIDRRSNYGKNYAFNNGGALIKLSNKRKIIAFTNWYNGGKPEDLEGALHGFEDLVKNANKIPLVWGGDFNSISHLDDGHGESGHSKLMTDAGFVDSYRQLYPDAKKFPFHTAPRNEDRIDYIYFKGSKLELVEAGGIIQDFQGKLKNQGYPSDHLGILATFKIK